MWIITTKGFISLVQDRKDHNMLQVRARVREDIERHFPGARVWAHNGADYRYRARISKDRVAVVLADMVLNELTYTSHFKDVAIAADKNHNATRRDAYYGCWNALARMQDYAPYSHISRADAAKRPPVQPRQWNTDRDVRVNPYGVWDRDTRDRTTYSYPGYGAADFYSRPVQGSEVDRREAAREPEVWDRDAARPVDIDAPELMEEMFTTEELDAVRGAFGIEPETTDIRDLEDMIDQLYQLHVLPTVSAHHQALLDLEDAEEYPQPSPKPGRSNRRNRRSRSNRGRR